jgi:hypothetical protein
MKVLEPVERYFEAWNSHVGAAIAACFDSCGGYTDPVSGQLPPPGISAYASGLFSATICASSCMSPRLTNRTSLRNGP